MNTLISDENAKTIVAAQLALHVQQPGVEDKTISIPQGKCTIGSSPSCLVQLGGGEVRPLHCLVVHSDRETVVTRWAPGVLLNGLDFSTATIADGDSLQIGDVELVFVVEERLAPAADDVKNDRKPEVASQSSQVDSCPQVAESESRPETERSCVTSQWFADRMVSDLWTANYQARQRCRGLVSSLRELRNEVGSTDGQIFSLKEELRGALEQRDQISSELSQVREEATEQELQVANEMGRLIEELNAANEQKNETESISAEQAANREQTIAGLEVTIEQMRDGERAAEERVAEQVARCEQLQGEIDRLHADREQLADSCKEYEQHQQGWEQALAERDQRIGELHREMQQTHSEILAAEERGFEQSSEREKLRGELAQLLEEQNQLIAVRGEYEARQQEWEQTLAARDHRIEELGGELEQSGTCAQQSSEQAASLESDLEQAQHELSQLQTERDGFVAGQVEAAQHLQHLEQTLSTRDHRIEELGGEVEQAGTSAQQASEQTASLESNLEQLRHELSQLQTERGVFIESQTEIAQHQQELEQTVVDRDQQLEALKLELEKVQTERDGTVEELQTEQTRLCEVLHSFEEGSFAQIDAGKKLEEELAAVRQERDELVAGQPEREQRQVELQEFLEARDRQIADLTEQLSTAGQSRGELEAEIASRSDEYQALATEVDGLRSHCEALSSESSASAERESGLQQAVTDHQQRFEALNGELADAREQYQSLEGSLSERAEAFEQQEAGRRELQEHFDKLAAEHAEEVERRYQRDQEVAERQQRVELLEVDLQSVRVELEQSTEQVARLESDRVAAEELLTEARRTLEEKASGEESEGDAALRNERDELFSSLEAAKLEVEGLRQQIEGHQGENTGDSSELIRALEEERNVLSAQVEEKSQLEEQRFAELEDIRQQLTERESHSQELDRQYQQSQQDLADARECLLAAEQALQARAAQAEVEVSESESEEDDSLGESNTEGEAAADQASTDTESAQQDGTSEEAIARLRELSVWKDQEGGSDEEKPQVEPEPAAEEFQPTSFIEQYSHVLEEGEASFEPEAPTPPVAVAPVETDLSDESDEGVLEEYMASMLQRMRGESSAGDDGVQLSPLADRVDSVAVVESSSEGTSQADGHEAEPAEAQEPIDLAELRQTSQKPKLPTDMAAMRELANSSARHAIAKHHKKRYLENAFGHIAICGTSLVVAVYMLMTAEGYRSTSFIAGCAAAFVGVVWVLRLLGNMLEAIRTGSNSQAAPAEIPVEDKPLPIDGSTNE